MNGVKTGTLASDALVLFGISGDLAHKMIFHAVEPVLKKHSRSIVYKRGGWGPKQADALIAADGGWFKPKLADAAAD